MDIEAANHVPYRQAHELRCDMTQSLATNKAWVDIASLGLRGKRDSPGAYTQTLVAGLGSQGLTVLKVEVGELLFQVRHTSGMLSAAADLQYASVFSSFNGISIDSEDPLIKASKGRNSNIKNYIYRKYDFVGIAITSVPYDQQNYKSVHGAAQLLTNGICGTFTGYALEDPIGMFSFFFLFLSFFFFFLSYSIGPGTLLEWDIPTPAQLTDTRYVKFHNKQTGFWRAANYQSFNDHMDSIMGSLAKKTNGIADPKPFGDGVEIDFQVAFMRMIQEIGKIIITQQMVAADFANTIAHDQDSPENFKMNSKMKTLIGAVSDPMKKDNAVMDWLKFVPELVRDHGARIRAVALTGAKRGEDFTALLKP